MIVDTISRQIAEPRLEQVDFSLLFKDGLTPLESVEYSLTEQIRYERILKLPLPHCAYQNICTFQAAPQI